MTPAIASRKDRDGMTASGMADRARESYDTLDRLLKSLA
jgi:hypothetical protein